MHYAIRGQFQIDKAAEFLQLLTDGTIANQEPDGKEIVASMKRASIDHAGTVQWSEVCYCPTPLEHERATVYDPFFSQLETSVIDSYQDFPGKDFLEFLQDQAS
ncbi:MAG: hypothetical protein GY888_07650 [Planctomycetaceae bacterium]|nr:hypothetical protein [Planctomycetaceae bacterium]